MKTTDWSDAYANGAHIPNSQDYPPRWQAQAQAWREHLSTQGRAQLDVAYGNEERQAYDVFRPEHSSRGLAVFVHGGYWRAFDRRTWSHFAAGAVTRGWTVVMPSYTLAPQARIEDITREIAQAIAHAAAHIQGPIALSGHSAGGHLVTRMVCSNSPLDMSIRTRIQRVASISGVHDLRPLVWTDLNDALRLDDAQAEAESPLLLRPDTSARITAWVGAAERPAFLLQSDALHAVWSMLGADIHVHHEPARHHFDVIEDLARPQSALCEAWLGA